MKLVVLLSLPLPPEEEILLGMVVLRPSRVDWWDCVGVSDVARNTRRELSTLPVTISGATDWSYPRSSVGAQVDAICI
jgi:hypothetical protein